MTSDLRSRAAAAAEPNNWPAATEPGAGVPAPEQADLPDVEYTDPITDAEAVPVHVAWARVMADVQSIRKDRTAEVKTAKSTYRYQFRGIDQVFNAVGPALRRHGVMVLPVKVDANYAKTSSAGGSGMRECTVTVTYRIVGPKGDHIEVQSVGEGLDTSDKATTKATTMAYRNLLVNSLTVPTDDPKVDADNSHLQRGAPVMPKAVDYVEEIADPNTTVRRLLQIRSEIGQHNLGQVLITNEVGDEEPLGAMLQRIGKERQGGGS